MVLNFAYTLPGGEPKIRSHTASRAILMLLNVPNMWIFLQTTKKGSQKSHSNSKKQLED